MTITAQELLARGWNVALVGRSRTEFLKRAEAAGLPSIGWPFRWVIDPATLWAARQHLRRHQPDLVVVALGRDIRTIGIAADNTGLPIIWRLGVPYPRLTWWHRVTGKSRVSRVIVPSHYLKSRIEQSPWLTGKVDVVPNGIAELPVPGSERVMDIRQTFGWADSEFVILWVGRLKKQKGVDTLVSAFAQLSASRDRPPLRLVIVGTGPEEAALRRAAVFPASDAAINFVGYKADPSPYFDACDLVALPSHMETFGNVLLEAMARAKPIVASRVGGVPEVVGTDAAILVPPRDESALRGALSDLVRDPVRCRALGEAGRKRFVESFTVRRMADGVERVLRAVSAGGSV